MRCESLLVFCSLIGLSLALTEDSEYSPKVNARRQWATDSILSKRGISARSPVLSQKRSRIRPQALRIGIIGGGIGGLYAAIVLQSLGISYEVLEANPNRVGGRIETMYFDEARWRLAKSCDEEYYNYFDAGAMRFPLIESQERLSGHHSWSLFNYLNREVEEHFKLNLIPYRLHDVAGNQIRHYNNIKMAIKDMDGSRDHFGFGESSGGSVPDVYLRKPYGFWIEAAVKHLKAKIHEDYKDGVVYLKKFDHLSARGYLRTLNETLEHGIQHLMPYPNELIDYLETMDTGTGFYDYAFTDIVLQSYDFDTPNNETSEWLSVEGGSSRIIEAMVSLIQNQPLKGHRVTSIHPVIVGKREMIQLGFENNYPRSYDHVISTIPFNRYQTISTPLELSTDKRMAMRMMKIVSSVKVGLRFHRRWWEDEVEMNGKPIIGGQTFTDLPIRTIVYPSYGIKNETHGHPDSPGVLMVSYTWDQDAYRISTLNDSEVENLCLRNLFQIHGPVVYREYAGAFRVKRWSEDEYVGGAFAMFLPSQFTTHYQPLIKPEVNGRLHISGSAASINHGWSVGALTSTYRAIGEILQMEGFTDKLEMMEAAWGPIEEPLPL